MTAIHSEDERRFRTLVLYFSNEQYNKQHDEDLVACAQFSSIFS